MEGERGVSIRGGVHFCHTGIILMGGSGWDGQKVRWLGGGKAGESVRGGVSFATLESF